MEREGTVSAVQSSLFISPSLPQPGERRERERKREIDRGVFTVAERLSRYVSSSNSSTAVISRGKGKL